MMYTFATQKVKPDKDAFGYERINRPYHSVGPPLQNPPRIV